MASEETLLECLKQAESLYGSNHIKVAAELSKLGNVYSEIGEHLKARDAYEKALTIIERHYGPDHIEVGRALHNLGTAFLYCASGNETAKRLLKKALTIKTIHCDPGDIEIAETLHKLGNAYYVSHEPSNYQTAKEYFERALTIKDSIYGSDHLETAKVMNNLGAVAYASEDYESAKSWFEKSVPIMTKHCTSRYVIGTSIPFDYSALQNLRNVYEKLGNVEKSADCTARALNVLKQNCELDNPKPEGRSLYTIQNNITFLRGKRGAEPYWCYLRTDKEKQQMLIKNAKLGSINVKDYGEILYSDGRGDPRDIESEMHHVVSYIRTRENIVEKHKMALLNKRLTKHVTNRINNDVFMVTNKNKADSVWQYVLPDPSKREAFFEKQKTNSVDGYDYGKVLISGPGENPSKMITDRFKDIQTTLSNNLLVARDENGILHYVAVEHGKRAIVENMDIDTCTKQLIGECGIILYSTWGEDPPEIISHHLCSRYISLTIENINTTVLESPYISDLTDVSRNGRLELMEYFLKKVKNVNVRGENGWTALHHAAHAGKIEAIRYLVVDYHADIHTIDMFGRKPIHISSKEGHLHTVEFFLSRGASVDETDGNNWTPLHYAAWKGNLEMVEYLVRKKADISAKEKVYGRQAIHIATKLNHADVVRFLLNQNISVHVRDVDGNTLILYAAMAGNIETVEYLYNQKADILFKEYISGRLPVHFAAEEGHRDVVEFLISKGTDVDARDDKGRTTLHWAATGGDVKTIEYLIHRKADISAKCKILGGQPIHMAAEAGHKDALHFFLRQGIDVNVKDEDGRTPLHFSTFKDNLEMVTFLLENGADPHANARGYGVKPIHFASFHGHKDIIEFFIDKQWNDINDTDDQNWNCLHYAAYNGHVHLVRYLLDKKINRNLEDVHEYTAMDYARINGYEEIVNMLNSN